MFHNRKRKLYLERQRRHNQRRYIKKDEKEMIIEFLQKGYSPEIIAKVMNKKLDKIEELTWNIY